MEETKAKPAYGRAIVLLLAAIVALLAYSLFSAGRAEACRTHLGETAFIGTRQVVDAHWSLGQGCRLKIRDTSDRVFAHVSSAETEPDEWQDESTWQVSVEIDTKAREAVNGRP